MMNLVCIMRVNRLYGDLDTHGFTREYELQERGFLMSIVEYSKNIAAKTLVKGSLASFRAIPERSLMAAADIGLKKIDYAEGRDYMKTLILLAKRNLDKLSPDVQKRVAGFIGNALVSNDNRRDRFKSENGFKPPILLVISPTMRCNLNCYGCYAGKYSKGEDLGMDTLESILDQAEAMGVYFITISGGEPFMLGDELIDVFRNHPSILFQVYTNGTLINREVAEKLARTGNAYPCISVEGYEEETDARRGKGTYRLILGAMEHLRNAGVVFGFSATATRDNNDLLLSDDFIDFYRDRGCLVGWYFHYVPVGKEPGVSLMPTPEQRIHRLERLRVRREQNDILLADFWNDGPLVGHCLAGGSRYLHVTSSGDVEPCVFCHFAVDNIREKSLTEILNSKFFTEIRKRQPYTDNLYRPCMIIDVPEVLREVVSACDAHPTHSGAEAIIRDLAPELDEYAEEYRKIADHAWAKRTNTLVEMK
ncbi:MAG: radical SAM protein [Actinobacteria bacterium]|nr:radical SAM protein [Actinomycetota bacterium]